MLRLVVHEVTTLLGIKYACSLFINMSKGLKAEKACVTEVCNGGIWLRVRTGRRG